MFPIRKRWTGKEAGRVRELPYAIRAAVQLVARSLRSLTWRKLRSHGVTMAKRHVLRARRYRCN